MAFDGITIAAMVKELNTSLKGGRINKIAQPESDELLITVRGQDGQKRLLLSASPSLPLLYFTAPLLLPISACFYGSISAVRGSQILHSPAWSV